MSNKLDGDALALALTQGKYPKSLIDSLKEPVTTEKEEQEWINAWNDEEKWGIMSTKLFDAETMNYCDNKSAIEVIESFKRHYPQYKFAISSKNTTLGVYEQSLSKFIPFASLALTGEWYFMPYQININGKSMDITWNEV
jgi:hypothetical protein